MLPTWRRGRAAFVLRDESKLLNRNLLMLKSELSSFTLKFRAVRSIVPVLCLLGILLALQSAASAQTFTLSMQNFYPVAVNPGGNATSSVTVAGSGSEVSLTCAVTSIQAVTILPTCLVSPTAVTPPSTSSITFITTTSNGTATSGSYTVTITGTVGSTVEQTSASVAVLSVTPDFYITITSPVSPGSVPAGSGGQGLITVNPSNGYSGDVTLACSSITPIVSVPPACSFDYGSAHSLSVNGVANSATLTISTVGPNTVLPTSRAMAHRRIWNALWLPVPMLTLLGLGAATGGKRFRKIWGLLALFVLSGSLLLTPACGNTTTTTNTLPSIDITPNNTYTFTITGVDANGVVSSNAGSTSGAPTVSMTVTTATKTP